MSRFVVPAITLVALVSFTPLAQAQRGGHGGGRAGGFAPQHLPLSPGVVPASTIGPGTQFLQQPALRFAPGSGFGGGATAYGRSNAGFGPSGSAFSRTNQVGFGFGFGYGYGGYGYGYNGYGYGNGGYGYSYGGYGPWFYSPEVWYEPQIWLSNEFPATLTVQLPSGDTPKEYSLTSPVLKPGEQYTFAVNVRWVRNGKTYEAKRDVTLGPAARSRLVILSGDEVKE